MIVDSLSWSDIFLKFGTTKHNLLKKHSLFIANVPQCNKKWASLSTAPSGQYLQVLSIIGVGFGLEYLPVSMHKWWALILSLVKKQRWFLLGTISI